MFPDVENPYELAKYQDIVEFVPTSYIRGVTLRDAFIIVDECQNLNFHELDTIITRVGDNSRIFFCGDFMQTDLKNNAEQRGLIQFMDIIKNMKSFETIDFTEEDIVRSGLVKEYIISKNQKQYEGIFESVDKKMRQVAERRSKMRKWINARIGERTSWDGAVLIGAGVAFLIFAPIADIVAYGAIAYGAWTIFKGE